MNTATATNSNTLVSSADLGSALDRYGHEAAEGIWYVDKFFDPEHRAVIARFRTQRQLAAGLQGFGFDLEEIIDDPRWIENHLGSEERLVRMPGSDQLSSARITIFVDRANPILMSRLRDAINNAS